MEKANADYAECPYCKYEHEVKGAFKHGDTKLVDCYRCHKHFWLRVATDVHYAAEEFDVVFYSRPAEA